VEEEYIQQPAATSSEPGRHTALSKVGADDDAAAEEEEEEEEEGGEGKSKKAAAAEAAAASSSSVAVSDIDKTSMGPYMKQFEKSFLTPLYSDLHKCMRDEAELEAAAMGEF